MFGGLITPHAQSGKLSTSATEVEVHAELNTAKKLFSEAATSVNEPPNSHVALFDLAFPGTQPHFQGATLIPAIRAAIAFNCQIQRSSTFDRKHYFYQDQPAGYQITQYYEPFAKDGHIVLYPHDGIAPEDGNSVTVGIKQIQMEQDTAKTILQGNDTYLLDFNRVSHPLIEIITLPQIHSPATAAACVRKIQSILESINALNAGMELGGMRADVNVSIRKRGTEVDSGTGHQYHGVSGLGQRTEIKNLSSFKAVEDSIIAERNRQIQILESGGVIEGETRGWTIGGTETRSLRGKEGEIDYRYMPDPDIAPVIIGEDLVEHIHATMPLLPDDAFSLLTLKTPYGLSIKDAKTVHNLDEGERLDYYMEVVQTLESELSDSERASMPYGRTAGNWLLHELGGLFSQSEEPWDASRVRPDTLASVILNVLRKRVTGKTAKQLLANLFHGDSRTAEEIIEQDNLAVKPMSDEEYHAMVKTVLDNNQDTVRVILRDPQAGKSKVMWLVGQMIRGAEEGRVDAQKAAGIVREQLNIP
ncbi:Glutamyl-tRNA amidotransferase subunit B, mitochondrial [Eremomyces bilateralis CBS 781.70]|uniref:Glutamyl-tRNA(Gln) amidotransferase subunit B, mitochondrial n=1 Tax=Eremomyces bilateralis CBS 781.70 TaxID=1392243 RepID=A0A6G1GES8_9PEZI|nr:Glutamyl-tRNA amidotransferase subunit B, mitochondrial [Eremomyces bilateralis CBS 781.70]KAF1816534.1 Glutamyl-tRNA amidotransferase subunit B, mitochondrial [Eremomyces bilateralis CBS 781.70]